MITFTVKYVIIDFHISKTFTSLKENRLHSLIGVASIEVKDDLAVMKTDGLEVLEKTIFPTGDHYWRQNPNGYPKIAMLHFNQVIGLVMTPKSLRHWINFETLDVLNFSRSGIECILPILN